MYVECGIRRVFKKDMLKYVMENFLFNWFIFKKEYFSCFKVGEVFIIDFLKFLDFDDVLIIEGILLFIFLIGIYIVDVSFFV